MIKKLKLKLLTKSFIISIAAFFVVVAVASAVTTISANIETEGTLTVTGLSYPNGGLDRSTAAALAIGATNATALNITPATTITGALTVNGATATFGNAVADTVILNGRLSTSSVAGAALTLDSTYLYTEGAELRYTVTDWTGIGATSTFEGLYLRPQINTANATGNLKGIEVNTVNNGIALGSMHGAYLETQVKTIAASATVGPIYGIESQISLYAPTAGTLTLTEQSDVGVAAGRFQLGINSGLADYTSVYGVLIQSNDGSAASRTLGSGLLIRNYPAEGTQTWTKGIQITAPAVTGLSLEGAMTTGIDISGASTYDIKLQNDETIDNATDGKIAFSGGYTDVTRSLSSQTTENNASVLSLTTDSTYLTGTDITYSGARGSSALKITGTYSGVDGGYSNIYSNITNSGAHTADGAGVIGIKSVVTNTAALTDGNIYGGQFIAKHNDASNIMTASAALIGLEAWGYDSGAAPARTVIGGNFAYHNEGTTAKGAGSVYRGVQIVTDDAAGASEAVERTSLALWNMAGTQTNGIKFIKSDGGWTTDITLQNGETISNGTDGTIAFGAANLTNTGNITVTSGYINSPNYQVGAGSTFSDAANSPTKATLQQASYWGVITSSNVVDIDLPAMDAVDIGRRLVFVVTAGGTNALTVTSGTMTVTTVAETGTGTEDVGDAVDCLIVTTTKAWCSAYAAD